MSKLLVKIGFVDKDTAIFHQADEIVEYPEARAKEIEKRGFGEVLKISDEPEPVKQAEAKAKPKTKAKAAKKK